MAAVYRISVQLNIAGNALSFLSRLSSQLGHVHGQMTGLRGHMRTMFVGGSTGFLGAEGALRTMHSLYEKTKDLSHELTQIQKLGISVGQYNQLVAAIPGVTQAVPGTTGSDVAKLYGEIYSPLGHENAMKVLEPLAKFAQVSGNVTGNYKKAFDDVFDMVRAGHEIGKFVNETTHQVDTAKLTSFLDLGAKVIDATRGKVSAKTWFGLAQQGGPALSSMNEKGLIHSSIASQVMGGQRAGTALLSMFQQMVGGVMTQWKAKALHELGLVGDYTVARGGHVIFDKGALETPYVEALRRDPLEGVQLMKKAMEEHGITEMDAQVKKLFELFSRQTSLRLSHDQLRNLLQQLGETERIGGGAGVENAAGLQNSKDIMQAEHNLQASWTRLMETIGGPQSERVIFVLDTVSNFLRGIGSLFNMNDAQKQAMSDSFASIPGNMKKAIDAMGMAGGQWLADLPGKISASIPDAVRQIADTFITNIMALPGAVSGAIQSAIAGIGSAIGNALKGIGSTIEKGGGLYNPTSHRVPAAPPPGGRTIQVHSAVYLGPDKVGTSVTRHLVAGLNGPARGSEYTDYTSTFPQIA